MAVNSDNQQESSESQDYAIAEEPNVDKPQLPETKPEPAPQLNKKTEEPAKQNAKPSTTAETPKQEEKKHCKKQVQTNTSDHGVCKIGYPTYRAWIAI